MAKPRGTFTLELVDSYGRCVGKPKPVYLNDALEVEEISSLTFEVPMAERRVLGIPIPWLLETERTVVALRLCHEGVALSQYPLDPYETYLTAGEYTVDKFVRRGDD